MLVIATSGNAATNRTESRPGPQPISTMEPDDWHRYAASQWLNAPNWLASGPDDPEAGAVRQTRDDSRRGYLL
jgi:hypothetical protein